MRRLWLLPFAAALWAACDVVSNLGADGPSACDAGACQDDGAPDAADDAGDTGVADTGSWDSGLDSGCDASSCQGCCAGNTCIGYGSETSTQCGANGFACAPCSPDICDSGVCVPAPDAGCGPGSCNGCCGVSGCVQLSGESNSQCGNNGAVCQPCVDAGACSTVTGTCG